jgi:hypothetical protein
MNLTAKARAYIYGVAAALVAALVVLGYVTEDVAPLWLALVGAVLWAAGNLTAIAHTTSVGRAALYGVGLAVLALLARYQIVDQTQVPVWGALLAAVFGVGTNVLALAKVTPDVKADEVFLAGEPLEGEDI